MSPCWIWLGSQTEKGYGQIKWKGRSWRLHRLTYMLLIGSIPEGLELHHECDQRLCGNPAHARPVTHAEHMALMAGQGKWRGAWERCAKGHDDWYVSPKGRRVCRECSRTRDRDRTSGWERQRERERLP